MSTSNTNTFRAGYLFKPTHAPIHFVKEGHGISGDDYKVNFSCNLEDAKTFLSVDSARECIYDLLLEIDLDDDYEWTPVVTNVDGEIVGDISPMFKVGSSSFRKMYAN
jgi:hypothetical protein